MCSLQLTNVSPGYIQALRPDGSPLTFGYDVLDLRENNIGVVGGVVAFLFA